MPVTFSRIKCHKLKKSDVEFYTLLSSADIISSSVRRNALRTRDSFNYSMEPDISYMGLPDHIMKMVNLHVQANMYYAIILLRLLSCTFLQLKYNF